MIGLLYLVLSAFVLAALASWACSFLLYLVARWLSRSHFHFSSNFWFAMGVLPSAVGMLLAFLAVGSGWLSSMQWMPDHCRQHGGHPHLCLSHIGDSPPNGPLFWLVAAVASVLIAYAAVRSYLVNREVFLNLPESPNREGEFCLYPSRVPAAFTMGFFFPQPCLTTEAAKGLGAEEKAVILAHEREHIRRRDPLRLLFLQFCEACLPAVRHVGSRWQIAAELECDQAALRKGFSSELVAATILKLQRETQGYFLRSSLLNYAGNPNGESLTLRVESLLFGRGDSIGAKPVMLLFTILLIGSLLFFVEVHHMLETVLGWLI